MKHDNEHTPQPERAEATEPHESTLDSRRAYEPPRLMKKRSVARVTLFSAAAVAASGLTASG